MSAQTVAAILKPILKPIVRRMGFRRILIYIILLTFSVFYILPVFLILITSFKQYADVDIYRMWDLPPVWQLDNCTNAYIFCFDSFYEAWFSEHAVTIGMG